MRWAPIVLAASLSACGAPDAPPPLAARPGAAPGCAAGRGYALPGAYACQTPRSVDGPEALADACSSGWTPCSAPPKGCDSLPAFYIGTTGWRDAAGPAAGCGIAPLGAISTGLGCGPGAMREVLPRCGGWTRAADLPWGVGVLCCPRS